MDAADLGRGASPGMLIDIREVWLAHDVRDDDLWMGTGTVSENDGGGLHVEEAMSNSSIVVGSKIGCEFGSGKPGRARANFMLTSVLPIYTMKVKINPVWKRYISAASSRAWITHRVPRMRVPSACRCECIQLLSAGGGGVACIRML